MVGVFYSAFLVGVAISPLAFSLLRDAFGSYAPCLLWAAALLGVSSALVRGLPPFPDAVERDGHG
jgi:MFS family permease